MAGLGAGHLYIFLRASYAIIEYLFLSVGRSVMADKLKVGIMFCGGCNTYYDREEAYVSIRDALSDLCDFKPSSYLTDEKFDLVVIINGCPSVCMLDTDFGTETLLINNKNQENAAEVVAAKVRQIIQN